MFSFPAQMSSVAVLDSALVISNSNKSTLCSAQLQLLLPPLMSSSALFNLQQLQHSVYVVYRSRLSRDDQYFSCTYVCYCVNAVASQLVHIFISLFCQLLPVLYSGPYCGVDRVFTCFHIAAKVLQILFCFPCFLVSLFFHKKEMGKKTLI